MPTGRLVQSAAADGVSVSGRPRAEFVSAEALADRGDLAMHGDVHALFEFKMPAERSLQSAASTTEDDERALSEVTGRVLGEWRARIAAEYGSAAITQHFVLWLMQAGAPPDLIDAGLVIVSDELAHSRASHEVYVSAGGTEPPAIDQKTLALARQRENLLDDVLATCLRVFCLGETVAVPLFKHLRERCDEPTARAALDRILRDEVRHRDFGWDVLDWLMTIDEASVRENSRAMLPQMFEALRASYGDANAVIAQDDGAMTNAERAWGLAPPREYAEILARTVEREWKPRFSAREISW